MTFDISKHLPTRAGKPSKADSNYVSFRPSRREKRMLLALLVSMGEPTMTEVIRRLTIEAYKTNAEFMAADLREWVENEA